MFRESNGRVPFLAWFHDLPEKAQDHCRARLELLKGFGHELRRPAAENLGDGIYELRAKASGVNYRILYFFFGQRAVVLSHGIDKQRATVPQREIETAKQRRRVYEADPDAHTYEE